MGDYRWKDVFLTSGIAAQLALDKLRLIGKPIVKKELTRLVMQHHEENGGLPHKGDQERLLNNGFARMCADGIIEKIGAGYYRSIGVSSAPSLGDESQDPAPSLEDVEAVTSQMEVVAELSLGEGSEYVYVYFSESERKLAYHESRSSWPCKVGFTTTNVYSRILGQGIRIALSAFPTIGLIIKTDDAKSLEAVMHYALVEAEAWMEEAPGSEWFQTSPRKICQWYEAYKASIGLLK